MATGQTSRPPNPGAALPESEPGRLMAFVGRHATAIRWVAVVVIVGSAFLVLRQLPLASLVAALEAWFTDLGAWGPLVFGLLYVATVVFLVPAWALTLAAGAIFGPVVGTVVVSLASTMVAAHAGEMIGEVVLAMTKRLGLSALSGTIHPYPTEAEVFRRLGDAHQKARLPVLLVFHSSTS